MRRKEKYLSRLKTGHSSVGKKVIPSKYKLTSFERNKCLSKLKRENRLETIPPFYWRYNTFRDGENRLEKALKRWKAFLSETRYNTFRDGENRID
jgi:hypothetical protein